MQLRRRLSVAHRRLHDLNLCGEARAVRLRRKHRPMPDEEADKSARERRPMTRAGVTGRHRETALQEKPQSLTMYSITSNPTIQVSPTFLSDLLTHLG